MKAYKLSNNRMLNIFHDEYAESPRSYSNLGTMICFDKRYELGDEHEIDKNLFKGWNEVEKYLIKNFDASVILPIYMYEHGGVELNTVGFSCKWDSRQVGFIYVSKRRLRYEYDLKRIDRKIKDLAKDILIGEVKIYSDYLNGDVYGFSIDEDDKIGGFYGFDVAKNGMLEYLSEEDSQLVLAQL